MKLNQKIINLREETTKIYLKFNLIGKVYFGILLALGFIQILLGIFIAIFGIAFIGLVFVFYGILFIGLAILSILFINYINKTYNNESFIYSCLSYQGKIYRLEYFLKMVFILIIAIPLVSFVVFSFGTLIFEHEMVTNMISFKQFEKLFNFTKYSETGFFTIVIFFISFLLILLGICFFNIVSLFIVFLLIYSAILVSNKRIKDIGVSNYWYLLIIIILIPFVNILYFIPSNALNNDKICPHCAEKIKIEAKVCRYCNRELLS